MMHALMIGMHLSWCDSFVVKSLESCSFMPILDHLDGEEWGSLCKL